MDLINSFSYLKFILNPDCFIFYYRNEFFYMLQIYITVILNLLFFNKLCFIIIECPIFLNRINIQINNESMARSNNTKTFAIGIGIMCGLALITWFVIWLWTSSGPKAKKPWNVKNKEQEDESVESGEWVEKKWGWRKYDKEYGNKA